MKKFKEYVLNFIDAIGISLLLLYDAALGLTEFKKVKAQLIEQMEFFGVRSIFLVALASSFIGMVSSVQTAYQIKDYAPLDLLGMGVAKVVMMELGPVITALIVAGRVGSGIAAELGTMRITEQIDALETLGIDSKRHLILPRILSGIIIMPLLVVLADFVAITSSSIVSKLYLKIPFITFYSGIRTFFYPIDLWGGLLKGLVFGFLIAFVSSSFGYYTKEGAKGVGIATTQAVMYSSLLVLMFDYLLGILLYG